MSKQTPRSTPQNVREYFWSPSSNLLPIQLIEEQKSSDVSLSIPTAQTVSIPRTFLRSSGFQRALTRPIKAKLFSNLVVSSSAANAAMSYANVYTFAASNFPEVTSYSTLYDEARVLNVKLHYTFVPTTQTATYGVAPAAMAISFDPTVAAPTQTYQCLSEAHTTGLLAVPVSNTQCGATNVYSGGRLPYLSAKLPSPLAPITSSDCPGSAWFALDAGTAPSIFVQRLFCTPLGALGVSACYTVAEIDVEFRLRV